MSAGLFIVGTVIVSFAGGWISGWARGYQEATTDTEGWWAE